MAFSGSDAGGFKWEGFESGAPSQCPQKQKKPRKAVKSPAARLVVSRLKRSLSPLPARRSSACPIIFIPNKNRLSPPSIVSTLKISIPFISFPEELFKINQFLS